MKIILLILVSFVSSCSYLLIAQNNDPDVLYGKFVKLYRLGNLAGSEKILLQLLNSKDSLPIGYRISTLNNLGATYNLLGKYNEALDYYNKAEVLLRNKQIISQYLGDIYINKAIIYNIQKSYSLAVEYFEKGIRIYNNMPNAKEISASLSSAYLNYGISLLEFKDYHSALDLFNKSAELKLKNELPGLALVYLNIAKTFTKTGNPEQAEKFYTRSIDRFTREFNENYFRLAEVYFDYGLFLRSHGKNAEALEAHRKALSICLRNYKEKHTLVSLSYKHLGDHYFNQSDYMTALEYYQKSLISVVNDFNNPDIYSNPSIDSSLLDIRLLDNLKSKAQALELLAIEQNDQVIKLKTINKSLETIELTLLLISRIRNNYLTEESRIYLAENEKETYLFAIHIANTLYTITGKSSLCERMYSIAQKAKTAMLRNEITENDLLYSTGIPDSTREKRNRLAGNIAAYNNLLINEFRKISPDSNMISLWKDAIFDMNRDIEKINVEINRDYPQFHNLLQKTEVVPLTGIQKNLHRNETIVDYILSNQYKEGERNLYIFLITRNKLKFYQTSLDSVFLINAEIIRDVNQASITDKFRDYTGALSYMYEKLVKPVENFFDGNKLMIIPDEEIEWLPFDAFLKSNPGPKQTDYEGLQYLIYNYTFSFGYSSSLLLDKKTRIKRGEEIFAFSPDYGNSILSAATFNRLQGAEQEIGSIYRLFKGKKFTGYEATETNFMKVIGSPAIFHLAMHSISDTLNSMYSYLLFDTRSDTIEDGKLYNYEISLVRIKSTMVVLSACNSGTGILYHGEGLMSLARSFILAGVSSVIRTAWEVNDETSAEIISRFYYYLSRGKHKDEALRLAKLDYLKVTPPAFTSPYFWATYEILGDNAPISLNYSALVLIISLSVIIASSILFLYFKRRRIFSDRSL